MSEIVEVAVVMLVATAIRSALGFGEALIAVPLLALVIPVEVAAPVAVLASVLVAGYMISQDWRHIHLRSAGHLVLSTFFGIPFGLLLLKTVNESLIKGILGLIILCFSIYSLTGRKKLELRDDRFAWLFGFIAGVFGGAYGINGPPLAIYGSLRGWPPEKFRATLQGYFFPASIAGLCGFGIAGLWTHEVNRLFFWCLPPIVGGTFLGRYIGRRLDAGLFLRCMHTGLCFIGLLLIFQAVISK